MRGRTRRRRPSVRLWQALVPKKVPPSPTWSTTRTSGEEEGRQGQHDSPGADRGFCLSGSGLTPPSVIVPGHRGADGYCALVECRYSRFRRGSTATLPPPPHRPLRPPEQGRGLFLLAMGTIAVARRAARWCYAQSLAGQGFQRHVARSGCTRERRARKHAYGTKGIPATAKGGH